MNLPSSQSPRLLTIIPSECEQLCSIQLPCLTTDINKAYEYLGSENEVKASLQCNSSILSGSFASHRYDKKIKGNKIPQSGLLLRLKRKKLQHDGTMTCNHDIEVLGYVSSNYTFNQPFDYQVSDINYIYTHM